MISNADQTLILHLQELIAALDRRVPGAGRAREHDIARQAQRLRHEALERITELERPATAACCSTEPDRP